MFWRIGIDNSGPFRPRDRCWVPCLRLPQAPVWVFTGQPFRLSENKPGCEGFKLKTQLVTIDWEKA
jgi:hypothetical protein